MEALGGAGGKPPGKMPPGSTQGHQVQKDPVAARLRERLDQGVKRVLRLWAPSLLWCMLARGIWTGFAVRFGGGGSLAGLLLAQEAGVWTMDFEGRPFDGKPPTP